MSLTIPMLVEAYLSDGTQVNTKWVPQVSPDYSTALFKSFLGSKNTPVPIESKLPPLKRGVHLHFIIPDELKKSNDDGDFPPVPDRYIVTRFIARNDKTDVMQWVIESNFISLDKKYSDNVKIPMFSDNGMQKYRYCGRSYNIKNTPADKGEYLSKLSVLGGGDPLFAAYYPNCYSIFGFNDPMDDINEGAEVSYFVVGYYQDKNNDPFNSAATKDEFKELLMQYKLSVNDNEAVCSRVLLFGVVENIKWTNGTIADNIPKGNINIAIGKNSAEALSTVTEKLISPKSSYFQKFFNAFQYAETREINNIDGEALLDEYILLRQFGRVGSNNETYTLRGSDEENFCIDSEKFAHLLNSQNDLGIKIRCLNSERKKLYSLWEQYMILSEGDDPSGKYPVDDILKEISRIAKGIENLNTEIEQAKSAIDVQISEIDENAPEGIISHVGEAPFYIPKDPAVLLCGEGIKRSYAFGENGRFESDGTLLCQVSPITCNIDSSLILGTLDHEASELGNEYEGLLVQAAILISSVRKTIESRYGELKYEKNISPIAVNSSPEDFVSLFMDWKAHYYPLRTSGDAEPDNTLSQCSFLYDDMDFTTEKEPGSRYVEYTGRSVLMPHAIINLKNRFDEWLSIHSDDEDAKKAAELLADLPMISQSLGGFNEQLSAMMQAYQFPVIGNGGDEEQAKAVSENVSGSRVSVMTDYPMFPLRGGFFKIYQLNIVGTFGQIQQVYVPGNSNDNTILYSESLKCNDPDYGYLSPSFMTPTRLSLNWLWKDDLLSSSVKGTSPVEGFIVPELLNKRFTIYDTNGRFLGEIKIVLRNKKLSPRWLSAPGLPLDLQDINMSEILKKFLNSLVTYENAFVEVMEITDKVLFKNVSASSDAIWGKALALSKLEAVLEFDGDPDFTKVYSDLMKYNTLGVENVHIPLALGDINRSYDGFIGAFISDSFDSMYPPFGTDSQESSYVKYGSVISISASSPLSLYVLSEAYSDITVQTGMHPVYRLKLPLCHCEICNNLELMTEVNNLITSEKEAEIFPTESKDTNDMELIFNVKVGDKIIPWEVTTVKNIIKDAVICDGRITAIRDKEDKNG